MGQVDRHGVPYHNDRYREKPQNPGVDNADISRVVNRAMALARTITIQVSVGSPEIAALIF